MGLRDFFHSIGIGGDHGQKAMVPALTDFHSHILPGVDDGVATMDESLAILDRYESLGLQHVWLTPHIMEEVPNEPDDLRRRFEELKQAYQGNIQLHLAAENMIDNLFIERLGADNLLPIGDKGDHLLVETSYFSPPEGFDDILISIMDKGYRPLLAHPERYRYMIFDDYLRLKDMGIKLQLNILSLSGFYGPQARDRAVKLASEGLYDYSGTDIHRFQQADHLEHILSTSKYSRYLNNIKSST